MIAQKHRPRHPLLVKLAHLCYYVRVVRVGEVMSSQLDEAVAVSCPGQNHPPGMAPLGWYVNTTDGPCFTNGHGAFIMAGMVVCPVCAYRYHIKLQHKAWSDVCRQGRARGAFTPAQKMHQ